MCIKFLVVSHITDYQCVVMNHLKLNSIAIYVTCYEVPEDCNAAVAFDLFGRRFKFVTTFTKDANVANVLNEYSSSAKKCTKVY